MFTEQLCRDWSEFGTGALTIATKITRRASKAGADVGIDPRLDGKIAVSDLVAVVSAFGGKTYPFLPADIPPPPGPCPPQ